MKNGIRDEKKTRVSAGSLTHLVTHRGTRGSCLTDYRLSTRIDDLYICTFKRVRTIL